MNSSTPNNLLWWAIPNLLAGMPMPFIHPERRMNHGGPLSAFEDDLPLLHSAGIRAVVSLINLTSDSSVYASAGFAFICLPVPDGFPPTHEQAAEFVRYVNEQHSQNHPVAVHCEAGLGRTGTLLGAYLISHGASAQSAITTIRSVERVAIETQRQIQFLEQFEQNASL
ncbi:phosphatase domain-containing putative toxin [Pedosphaera parvula]|uniref:Dual specificity protein phosphatase n=1 Tax=Pedosphaera parvula (strain Ellin514) TaxID=320771 RepID=B9XNL2_PEDPL|nr:dual specificity protein phosphatase family protein [Pedosphaera parvula]EEF58552.1 dual specificity protein phosphatase [Pedosphaera parvula Ellin514]